MSYLGKTINPYGISPISGRGMGDDLTDIVSSLSQAATSITKSVVAPYSSSYPYSGGSFLPYNTGISSGLDTSTLMLIAGAGLVIYFLMKKK
jgi:hypothetical protein